MADIAKRQTTDVVEHQGGEVVDAFLAMIERAARDPAVDINKMERLFEMRERVFQRDAETAFNEALKAAKRDMPSIKRNKRNTQTNSNYADLEQVSHIMDPVITRHGFNTSFGTAESPLPNHYRITCLLTHDMGHSKDYFADIPIDSVGLKGNQNKTLTHAFGSTMSYGRRYLKTMIFDVATTDDDGNAAGSPYITEDQVDDLEILISQANADRVAFLKLCKIERLADMPAKKFDGARARLIAKRDAQS